MAENDFINAFARLLRDGALRDAFAVNPELAARQAGLPAAELPAWRGLDPAALEVQAEVLLQKRLDLVKHFAPETCDRLGENLWPQFRAFARCAWPPAGAAPAADAFAFCRQLKSAASAAVAISEWRRLSFAFSQQRLSLRWVRMPPTRDARTARWGLQVLLRGSNGHWREFFLYLGL